MDPQKSWTEMLDALKQENGDEAREFADALLEWLRIDGFPPVTVGDESLGKKWHTTIASFVCHFVRTRSKEVLSTQDAALSRAQSSGLPVSERIRGFSKLLHYSSGSRENRPALSRAS